MNPNNEGLVGPRSHEREDQKVDEFHSKNGEPLWMALLSEDETLAPDAHTVQEAKNKLIQLMAEHPEDVKACKDKSTEECRQMLQQYDVAA